MNAPSSADRKVILITGASTGFGRDTAESQHAALGIWDWLRGLHFDFEDQMGNACRVWGDHLARVTCGSLPSESSAQEAIPADVQTA
jgi:hypothetical protein